MLAQQRLAHHHGSNGVMKVRTASRSTGGVVISVISRTPGQRQLQRARDRRRGQRQHMHVGLSAFSRSLCATPKCCSSSTTSRPEIA